MSSLPVTVDPLAVDVSFTVHQLRVVLADGREILVPLLWFPRLQKATDEQRKNWRGVANKAWAADSGLGAEAGG